MRCPFCGHEDTQVKDSRPSEDGGAIRRRRFCANCGQRFTTIERTQLRELTVLKSDGRRVPFERDKLARSIRIACASGPIQEERIERIVNGIVRQLESSGESDIPSKQIGELVMDTLREVDSGRLCPLRQRLPKFPRSQGLRGLHWLAGRGHVVAVMPAPSRPSPAEDIAHMRSALALGRRGIGNTWPNPSVGCVIVNDGRVVGRAVTAPGGRPHAEPAGAGHGGRSRRGTRRSTSRWSRAATGAARRPAPMR